MTCIHLNNNSASVLLLRHLSIYHICIHSLFPFPFTAFTLCEKQAQCFPSTPHAPVLIVCNCTDIETEIFMLPQIFMVCTVLCNCA